MKSKQGHPGAQLVWERPEPGQRAALAPLSRERIVQAALEIADGGGLDAVSIRSVGAALDAGPMRLYGYIASKEELLALMVDRVYGDIPLPPSDAGDWRAALRSVACELRRAAQRHAWFIELLGGRPHIGPNALAHLEATFAALARAPGFADIDLAMRAAKTLHAYVIGAVRSEASETRAEADSAMSKQEWQQANGHYMQKMMATGRFPNLERVVKAAVHHRPDVDFQQGLELVLDGLGGMVGSAGS